MKKNKVWIQKEGSKIQVQKSFMKHILFLFYFRDMNKRITEDQAKMTFERTQKLEHEFGEYFTCM